MWVGRHPGPPRGPPSRGRSLGVGRSCCVCWCCCCVCLSMCEVLCVPRAPPTCCLGSWGDGFLPPTHRDGVMECAMTARPPYGDRAVQNHLFLTLPVPHSSLGGPVLPGPWLAPWALAVWRQTPAPSLLQQTSWQLHNKNK